MDAQKARGDVDTVNEEDFIEIEGKWYHRLRGTDSPLCWEDGDPMPAYVCICAAHSCSECCCGAWDMEIDNE